MAVNPLVDGSAYSMRSLKRGQVFHVPDVSALPDEAGRGHGEFESEVIRTLVNMPVVARQRMIGLLGLDAVRQRRRWGEDGIRLLQLVGDMIASALDRKAAEQRLQDALLPEIHHRVKNNMQIVDSLPCLREAVLRDRIGWAEGHGTPPLARGTASLSPGARPRPVQVG